MAGKKRKAKPITSGTKEIRKGRIFIATDKGIFPISILKKFEEKPESQQLKESKYYREHGLAPLPFNVGGLLLFQDNCVYFDKCVKQIAKDVVGQGYKLSVRPDKEESEDEKGRILRFFDSVNKDGESITDVFERSIMDWGAIGWFGIETSHYIDDTINGLWHIPAHTIRVHETKKKFCQERNNKRIWFKAFGSEENISSKTGDTIKGPKNLAHELIYYKNYWSQSDYYGAPNIIPALGAITGLIGVRDYNLAFFQNYGIPAALITLTGQWEDDEIESLQNFIDVDIKGSNAAHKTAILNPPKGAEVQVDKLSVDIKEGSFRILLKDLRDECLVAYSMPPYRLGIAEVGKLGGSTAPESNIIYRSAIIGPLERITERIINKDIIENGLKCENYVFQWNEVDFRDKDAMAKRFQTLFSIGAMTPNQIIAEFGGKPYTEGGKYYVASTYIEVGEQLTEEEKAFRKMLIDRYERETGERIGDLPSGVDEEGKHG